MRIAIFENIMTPGGHEVDFNRILVEELKNLGHEIIFYVPENFQFQFDYQVPVKKISGEAVIYKNSRGLKKIFNSAKREINRQRWFSQLFDEQKNFDALIIPTSTYRYLRALNHNSLKKISVPLIFILHGINPDESPKFFNAAEKFLSNRNIKNVVLTFGKNIFGKSLENVFTIYPPTFIPRDIKISPQKNSVLKIGFFGQYRREKKLRDLLEVFVKGDYQKKVELFVQGSTMHAEDAEDFEKIISDYKNFSEINFLHKGLIGAEWQKKISEVDALLMPYSAPRYKYHWGGMLFTAIGFEKPVIVSNDMNPEVFEMYKIGETFESGNLSDLAKVLEDFINNFDENISEYKKNLREADENFSPVNFAKRLEKVILS